MLLLRPVFSTFSVATLLFFSPFSSPAPGPSGDDLARAAKSGRLNQVKTIVAEDPSLLDVPDGAGYTPLRWAGIRDHGKIARFLLESGADPNSVGDDGGTPMHGAAHHDDPRMMTALLSAGGDVTHRNQWGRTPLHVAARRGCIDVAHLLLDAGADLEAVTHEGWSPLHVAYRGGHPEFVDLLLAEGADPNLLDGAGLKPGEITLVRPDGVGLSRRLLDEYVGGYDLGGGYGFDVWRTGDRLHLMEFAPDEMIAAAPDTFVAVREPWLVIFKRDAEGKISSMDVDFLRQTVSARKVNNPSEGYTYLGSQACLGCHQDGSGGGPAGHWTASRHSRAFHTLTTDQAELLAAGRDEYSDITDPSQEPRCIMCHLTAAQEPLAAWSAEIPPATEGVGCEACHGPGSAYTSAEIMADRGAFLANGGRIPDELTCRQCHRDEAFDFLERLVRIEH